MFQKSHWRIALFVASLLVVCGVLLVPASANTCYGTLYEYFDGPSHTVQVGAKVSCPGFPDQFDSGDNGGYAETPWYTTTTVVCPCPGGSGGGGGTGGGDCTEQDLGPDEECP